MFSVTEEGGDSFKIIKLTSPNKGEVVICNCNLAITGLNFP